MKNLIFFAFVLLTSTHAYAGTVTDPVVINVDDDYFSCVGDETWFEIVDIYPPDTCGSGVTFPDPGRYTVIFYSGDCSDRVFGCSGVNDTGIEESRKTFYVYSDAGNYNSTWGGDNGMWGSIEVSENLANVASGVQETGASLWPLFAFVGIGLAFVIAGMLVSNIRNSTNISSNKKEIVNPDGEEFIYHDAETLEFRRNYGNKKL